VSSGAPAVQQKLAVAELVSPDAAAEFWETDYRRHVVARAMESMQSDFQPTTWKACWEFVVSGRSAAEVAAELGISRGAVYAAKFRVLTRLRQELDGVLDRPRNK
jgi:RNA polymerase sigma-70 factor (ECF subfamily)